MTERAAPVSIRKRVGEPKAMPVTVRSVHRGMGGGEGEVIDEERGRESGLILARGGGQSESFVVKGGH